MIKRPWTLEFSNEALKILKKLDKQVSEKIVTFLNNRLITLYDPRLIGKSLEGNLKNFWSYRVGDYWIICDINDDRIVCR